MALQVQAAPPPIDPAAIQQQAVTAAVAAAKAQGDASYAKPADVAAAVAPLATSSALATVQATIPTPAAVAPPAETVVAAAGTDPKVFAMANHTHPRITRAAKFVVGTNGTLSGNWLTALPGSAAPNMIYTPTLSGTRQASCQNAAAPTVSGFSAVCFMASPVALNLSVVTTGLSVGPTYLTAGTSVDVTALPPTQ